MQKEYDQPRRRAEVISLQLRNIGIHVMSRVAPMTVVDLFFRSDNLKDYYDAVITTAKKAQRRDEQYRGIQDLQGAVKLISFSLAREHTPQLKNKLALIYLHLGILQTKTQQSHNAVQSFRCAANTAGLGQAIHEVALVELLKLSSAEVEDTQKYAAYTAADTIDIAIDDAFVIALREVLPEKIFGTSESHELAIQIIDNLRRRGLAAPWLLRLRAKALAEQRDHTTCIAELTQLLQLAEATLEDHYFFGLQQEALGDLSAALHTFEAILSKNDISFDVLRRAGEAALKIYSENPYGSTALLNVAIQHLTHATEMNSGHAETWMHLGKSLTIRGDFEQARRAFEQTIACGNDNVAMRIALGEAIQKLGDLQGYQEQLRNAADIAKTDGILWQRAGAAAVQAGAFADAIRFLDHAAHATPMPPEALLLLAQAHIEAGNPHNAAEILIGTSNLSQQNSLLLARTLASAGDAKSAMEKFSAYLAQDPGNEQVCFELANTLFNASRWKDAAGHFMRIRTPALRTQAMSRAAYAFLRIGNLTEADRICGELQTLNSTSGLLHHVRASLAYRRGDAFTARAEWNRALQLEPTLAPALYGSARLYESQKDFIHAADIWTELRRTAPTTPGLTSRIAICMARAGEYENAVAMLESANTSDVADNATLECLAYCYTKLEQWSKATDVLDRMPEKLRTSATVQRTKFIATYENARTAHSVGNLQNAVRLLQHLADDFPEKPLAARTLATVELSLSLNSNNSDQASTESMLKILARAEPNGFVARVLPALLDLLQSTSSQAKWSEVANVIPTNEMQRLILAAIAIAKEEWSAVADLARLNSSEENNWQPAYLRGVAALHTQQWNDAYENLRAVLGKKTDLNKEDAAQILRITVAAAVKASRIADAQSLVQTHTSKDAQRMLSILLIAAGETDAAALLLTNIDPKTPDMQEVRSTIGITKINKLIAASDWESALKEIASLPQNMRESHEIRSTELELQLRIAEATATSQKPSSISVLQNSIANLLLQQQYLRRAAILATYEATTSEEPAQRVCNLYRLAAALWASALESEPMWAAFDAERIKQGRDAMRADKRAAIIGAARTQLHSKIHAHSITGWSANDVDMLCSWVDYEFTCCALFTQSGVGHTIPGWIDGLSTSPYLLMQNHAVSSSDDKLKTLCSAAYAALEKHAAQTRNQTGRLFAYLNASTGFAEFLIDAGTPALALLHLDEKSSSTDAVTKTRTRALIAQATLLSVNVGTAHEALQMFEQAAALGADLSATMSVIVAAAVTKSRSTLQANPERPESALQPLETAKRLGASDSKMNVAFGDVYRQQALLLERRNEFAAAEAKYRQALQLDNATATIELLNSLLTKLGRTH